ncbi:hypothetical protein J1N09_04830 [Aureitalea sp. L0-47]|uniref:hypothetical protein n=1 Tax=Aureitalea sp. L0-47 TaxID=2816962 RepID=UPI0022377DB5|nr:hypothetical protein [Aureitalea sp. L0-47]MCW5519150.1 hypothetical protein [Aureitalea sp. L0-47]
MKKILVLLAITALFLSCNSTTTDTLNFVIKPSEINEKPALEVTLSFVPSDSTATVLLFQDQGWGQENLHNLVHNLRIEEGANEIIQKKEKDHYVIKHEASSEKITISYTLLQDTEGKLNTEKAIRPIINEDYFHIYSHNFFMLPKSVIDQTGDSFNVVIEWQEFPESYALQNSFGGGIAQQIGPISEAEFHSAVFVGGDFRIYEKTIEGNKVVFATRGEWEAFNDNDIVNVLESTLKAQRDFWEDHSQEYYLVSMIPTIQEQGYSFHGTGLTNSFSTTVSNNEFVEIEGLVYLFNHELQHNWTGKVIENANEEEQYWFSEGFTEYYTFRNIAANGIYELDEAYFVEKLNENVKNLVSSPVLAAPNSEINYENFWSSYDYSKLPYFRGSVFAFILDMKIRQESNGEKSLDDLMLRIKEDAVSKGIKLDHDYFLETTNEFLSNDITPFFETHIVEGKPFDLESIYSEFGLEYNASSEVFDLGFSFDDDRKFVAAVDEGSQAFDAGIREGDKVVKLSYMRDHRKEAEFTVLRDGKEMNIKYFPVNQANIPQLLPFESNLQKLGF